MSYEVLELAALSMSRREDADPFMDALNGVSASLYWIDHSRLMKMDIFVSFLFLILTASLLSCMVVLHPCFVKKTILNNHG
jgi:hypothetical protein